MPPDHLAGGEQVGDGLIPYLRQANPVACRLVRASPAQWRAEN